jgi:hypothetical protein
LIPKIFIGASAVISSQKVYKNEQPIFENNVGDISAYLTSIYQHIDCKYPKFYKMDMLAKLGWLAAEVLLGADWLSGKYRPEDVGVVLANTNASLDTDIKYFETTKDIASPALFVYTLPNIVIGEICIRHHFKGENAFFIFEKFDAGFIEQYVNGLVNNNILQSCICGWVEVLGEEYKAVLFLVEKMGTPQSTLFTKENIHKIYHVENG